MANEKRLIDAYQFRGKHEVAEVNGKLNSVILYGDIVNAPTVDAVEVKRGRWREKILAGGFAEEWGYVCSECGCTVSDRSNLGIGRYAIKNQRLNYCPNCGADMRGGEE